MDSEIPAMVFGLDERTFGVVRGTQAGKPTQATKGWGRIQAFNRIAPARRIRLIIPPGGIAGSNPTPATNFQTLPERGRLMTVGKIYQVYVLQNSGGSRIRTPLVLYFRRPNRVWFKPRAVGRKRDWQGAVTCRCTKRFRVIGRGTTVMRTVSSFPTNMTGLAGTVAKRFILT